MAKTNNNQNSNPSSEESQVVNGLELKLDISDRSQLGNLQFVQTDENPGDLTVILPDGSTVVLSDYIVLSQAGLPPALTLADGTVIAGEEVLGLIEGLDFNKVATAAGNETQGGNGSGAAFSTYGNEALGDDLGHDGYVGGYATLAGNTQTRELTDGIEDSSSQNSLNKQSAPLLADGSILIQMLSGAAPGIFEDAMPNMHLGDATQQQARLDINLSLNNADTYPVSVTINVPADVTLIHNGVGQPAGPYVITLNSTLPVAAQLADIFMLMPEDMDSDPTISVDAEFGGYGGSSDSGSANMTVAVDAVADMPVDGTALAELGVVGYYDMSAGQGVAAQVDSINTAGGTPVNMFTLSAYELAAIDVLYIQNPSNWSYGTEFLAQMALIHDAVQNGMTLVIHDRYVNPAESILPGSAGLNIVRNFSDARDIEIEHDDSLTADGPGGQIDDNSLDGGNYSSHGYAVRSSLPADAEVLLTTSDVDEVVTFSYGFGAGTVIYSSIPLDYYIAGRGLTAVSTNMEIYASNLLASLADDSIDMAPSHEDTAPTASTFTASISATFNDVVDGSEHHMMFTHVPDGWSVVSGSAGYEGIFAVSGNSMMMNGVVYPKTLSGLTQMASDLGIPITDLTGMMAADGSSADGQAIGLSDGTYAMFNLTAADMTSNADSPTSSSYVADVTLTLQAPDSWDMEQAGGEGGAWGVAGAAPSFALESDGSADFDITTYALAVDIPTDPADELTYTNNISLVTAGVVEVNVDPVHGQLYTSNSSGAEGGDISLNISFAVPDNELLRQVEISDVPVGAVINDSAVADSIVVTQTGPTSWVLTEAADYGGISLADLQNLTITPPAGNNQSMDLDVTATFSDPDTNHTLVRSGELEVSVNATTNMPEVLLNVTPDGGFVVAWSSNDPTVDGDSYGIAAQRFNNAGDPVGSEFTVNSNGADWQFEPAVTALADGGFVVTWESEDPVVDGTSYGVSAQIYGADGNPIGGEFTVNTGDAGAQDKPAVTALENGNFVVTWSSYDSPDDGSISGISAQIFQPDGTAVGGEFTVNTETRFRQDESSVTALEGGGFVVTWQGSDPDVEGPGTQSGISARIFDADGNPAGNEFTVNTEFSRNQEEPAITALEGGGFVVTWHSFDPDVDGSRSGIAARIFDAAGNPTGSEFTVNSEVEGRQLEPTVTALENGNFVVTWRSEDADVDGDNYGISAHIFEADGTPVGGEFTINDIATHKQLQAEVSSMSDGGFVVTWHSHHARYDSSDTFIAARIFDADGTPRGGQFQVDSRNDSWQRRPTVTALAAVGAILASTVTVEASFSDYQDGSETHTVIVEMPNGYTLESNPATWSDLPAGVTVAVTGQQVVFNIPTSGADALEEFSYDFRVEHDAMVDGSEVFTAEATAVDGGSSATATAMAGSYANNAIVGTDGDDVLTGGIGDDIMTGGAGDDLFLFSVESDGHDTITDFSVDTDGDGIAEFGLDGMGDDTINLDALFDSLGVDSADRVVDADVVGGNTVLRVGTESGGIFTDATNGEFSVTVDGVSLSDSNVDDLIVQGNIVVDES